MNDVIYQATYTDLDLYRQQSGPLQMQIVQLQRGRFYAKQQVLNLGDIAFCLTWYQLRQTTRVEMKPGHVTLALPFTAACWCGEQFPQHHAAALLPNCQSSTVLASDYWGLDVDMTQACAVHHGLIPEAWFSVPPSPNHAVLPVLPAAVKALYSWVLTQFSQLKNTAADATLKAAVREHGIELVKSAFYVPTHAVQDARPEKASRGLVFAAQALIDKHYREPITIESLARDLGVSERWLQISFKNIMGVSPYRYIMLARLHGAKRDLQSSATEHSVTQAALENGFGHLGRFSQQYRSLFGESPTDTLKSLKHN